MAAELDFQISDNSLNRLGFRIFTQGIRIESFERNPVALYDHNGTIMSIGKWKNLAKNGDKFNGTCQFDEEDEFAMKLYKKYKNGYMSGVSVSVDPLVESEDPADMLAGQELPTVKESELLEISLCNVPGNRNSVKLIHEGKPVQLSVIQKTQQIKKMGKDEKTVEQLTNENTALRKDRAKELVSLHVERGAITPEESTFFEKNAEENYEETKRVLSLRKGQKADDNARDQLATQLIELHFKRGAIQEGEKDFYKKAAMTDYEGTKKVLELRKGTEVIERHLAGMQGAVADNKNEDGSDRSKWKYMDYYKNDLPGLKKMKLEKPEEYKKLLEAHRREISGQGKYILEDEDES